jgi:HPt (histidine-containing phosphotransfer) domain-containing protein
LESFEISFSGAFAQRGVLESSQSNPRSAPIPPTVTPFSDFQIFIFLINASESMVSDSIDMVQDPTHPADSSDDALLRSEFHDDPEMREIVRSFLQEIPNRLALMDSLLEDGNKAEFRRVVHQIKGAGGGYGFQEISNAAAQLEQCMNLSGEKWGRDCLMHLATFQKLLRRAHAGLREFH